VEGLETLSQTRDTHLYQAHLLVTTTKRCAAALFQKEIDGFQWHIVYTLTTRVRRGFGGGKDPYITKKILAVHTIPVRSTFS